MYVAECFASFWSEAVYRRQKSFTALIKIGLSYWINLVSLTSTDETAQSNEKKHMRDRCNKTYKQLNLF
jgi:hypothetical protein